MRKRKKKNMNTMAKKITDTEGGKVNLSIAQVKEVLRNLAVLIALDLDYFNIFHKYVERKAEK